VLGEDIDPVEVEYFAAGVYAAKQAKSAAERAEKEGLAILKGLPHAEYGAFSYEPGGRWVTDLKKRAAQLEAHYDEPDETRPPLGTLDVPKRRDSWDTVKPVRAAKRQPKVKPPTPDEVLASAPDEVVPEPAPQQEQEPGQAVGA
jgi:hypothetical protein